MKAIVNETLTGKETSSIHRFELAGLGKAPFHFTGTVTEKVFVACPGATPKAGSSCDYCGTGIRYEFWVRSACDKEFKVGCDCIHKTGDRGLIQQISAAERKLRDAKNEVAKERRITAKVLRISKARINFPAVAGTLASLPHPDSYFAGQGKTLADYVQWCFDNQAGEKAAIYIERAIKGESL